MRNALWVLVLGFLFLAPSGAADESDRRQELEGQRHYYEGLLRDCRTETAAKYFVERLGRIEDALNALGKDEQPAAEAEPSKVVKTTGLGPRTVRWLRIRLKEIVREKTVRITDAVAWTRRELPEEMMVAVAQWLNRDGGAGVTVESAKEHWAARPRATWLSAKYGSGTYIVKPPRPNPGRRATKMPEGVKLPKPPTRDEWWQRASPNERAEWVLAYFVENSGLFELADDAKSTKCPVCNGAGMEQKILSNGVPITYVCTRCAGVGRDHTVRFR
ncbi:MAG: hypothetical protein QNJ98_03845 [Planctomycetota bacterium]|nr:hypothetical protein [Planctomycetota bacterium]